MYMYMYIYTYNLCIILCICGCAVLLCLVCLFDLACFFLSSFSSHIKNMYIYTYNIFMYNTMWAGTRTLDCPGSNPFKAVQWGLFLLVLFWVSTFALS